MALDRWIALALAAVFVIYGYTAYFGMDELLPPILQRNPIWPSTFPKILAGTGFLISIVVLLNLEKAPAAETTGELDIRNWRIYKTGQALALIILMFGYALLLRTLGFLAATFLFMTLGSLILGERRLMLVGTVGGLAAGICWYLVDKVLGIYLSPLPQFVTNFM